MSVWVKSKKWMKLMFPKYVWKIKTNEKKIYLTFDDGPTPEITNWVLKQLKIFNAKATFFCIGNNIQKYPTVFNGIINEKHSVGNHTFNHLNGWKTDSKKYIENTILCQSEINNLNSENNTLFRPPYGKIKPSQSRKLRKMGYKIIMWDIISFDFDSTISKEKCLENVLKNIENGSIVVFHDSQKAWKNLEYVLPKTLDYLKEKGFSFEKID
ncbi:polysaccharide deacetylase family protein [Flavobacterium capsici]|uniref:Polysaccharide deacetylase family protein n=2 Tax=Flavobacterium capsici TaxID=3075618 RepID=A0AA96EY75_9FLAO|nr:MULTISPECIES: polysaccharide deacetylase family protein [unclassified Flavobacterium]WNM20436.1 polysaccharide deacetylase family protein [Flavobacterium sp. PMR2A8]WNM23143.1 polysaccharide deacetylase family protein [Flavobacterium sp. PMTSA4]